MMDAVMLAALICCFGLVKLFADFCEGQDGPVGRIGAEVPMWDGREYDRKEREEAWIWQDWACWSQRWEFTWCMH